jgi:exodeoxyribonuclease VII large subunit
MVANMSLKTPTAVADFLIDSVASAENYIIEMITGIINASRIIIERNKNRIESSSFKLFPLARIMLSAIKDTLTSKIIEINRTGKELIFRAALIPANHKSKLSSSLKSIFSRHKLELERNNERFINSTERFLAVSRVRMNSFESTLQLLNPQNVLLRGYTITSFNGEILKVSSQLKEGNIIDTQFSDGIAKSKVIGKNEKRFEPLND